MDQHIVNAKIVNEGTIIEGDLVIQDQRIAGIGATPRPGADVFDAQGAFLLPGMIDDQVHFREPGMEHKGTIATESAAAVAGGIDYLRAVASPFADAVFCPTGGISAETAADWLALSNVACVGGTWFAPRDLLAAGDFAPITARA